MTGAAPEAETGATPAAGTGATPEAAIGATPGTAPAAAPAPSGTGCADCLAIGGWWLHLRRCVECGHIGCCDSSPARHARAHAAHAEHPVAASFEPGEGWFWNYATESAARPVPLSPPRWRPEDQECPGPSANVPADWRRLLH